MKKLICLVLIMVTIFLISGCQDNNLNSKYLRIHIRADNNEADSQSVKYVIKEKLVFYLTPLLASCINKEQALGMVESELGNIKKICNETLSDNGFSYGSNAKLSNEYFPLRSYGDFVFKEGFYDSLIVELGQAKGDNWWCMVYPPLCFTKGEANGSSDITYKSKILEIIEEFRQKYLS